MVTGRTNRNGVRRNRSAIAAAAVLGVVAPTGLSLAQTSEVTVDIERCLELESPEERQACFGAEVDQALQDRSAGEADRPAAVRQPDRPRETPDSDAAASQQAVAAAAPDSDDGEFFGTIVEMREYLPSAYIIRLDNGQIWEQTEPKRYPLRPGLEVRIYPTRWGTRYRLTGLESGGHIQVRRVQ